MSIIITGCAGFIGSHVTEEFLSAGYNVIGIDSLTYAGKESNMSSFFMNQNFNFERKNINQKLDIIGLINNHEVEWIINLAAETHVDNSIKDDMEFITTNIIGVRNLLQACMETNCKLLHFSTDEVYGVADDKSFTEESPLKPKNPYSASKASADHMIQSYANTHGTKSIIVRPSNNFGLRQDSEKFLPTIIESLENDRKIPVYGKGEQIREWTHVANTAKATRFILENSPIGETYNITSGFHLKNIDLVKKVCYNLDLDYEECIEFVEDRPGHDFKYSISSDKLNSLGFVVENNFEEGLFSVMRQVRT